MVAGVGDVEAAVAIDPESAGVGESGSGAEAVGLIVVKQSDANELKVSTDAKAKLDQLKALLPEGTELKINDETFLIMTEEDILGVIE